MTKKSLRRKPGNLPPKNRICILTEGKVTEVEYLMGVCERLRIPKELVIIKKAYSTQAKKIVDELVEEKKHNARLARKGMDALIDQWWAVCDTECDADEIRIAVQKARDNSVFLAISDPSIEYWLLLHFKYSTSPFESAEKAVKAIKESNYLPGYDEKNKHPDMGILYPLLRNAMSNSRMVRKNHTMQGYDQPRTDCDLLIDAIAMQSKLTELPFPSKDFNSDFLSMNTCC